MRRAGPQSRASAFAEARGLLAEVDKTLDPRDADYAPLRRRALVSLARSRGLLGWLWFLKAF
jgi:hypothetical protein